jgi:LacI family transcriptional regulator
MSADFGRTVSMRDIAEACGVSVVTVSRALKGDRNHSAATREKVLSMAEKLGYRTSPLVAALMSARGRHKPAKGTVNLALLNPGGDWRGHPFYEGVIAQARALGFSIETFAMAENGARRLRKILQSRGVRGVILLPAPKADARIDFDISGFAAATIGYSVIAPNMPRVVTDTYGRIREALTRAEERGYRRIGLLGTDDLDRRFQHLSTAAVGVFRETGPRKATVHRLNLDPAAPDAANCAEVCAWVRKLRLDAVLSQVGLHPGFAAAGLRIPDDVGYVYLHRADDPKVTCMDQNQEWIGRKATDVVVGMINRNEFQVPEQSQTTMIPSVWCEGETLPIKKAARR